MNLSDKKNLLDSGDACLLSVGANSMEVLLFSLGTQETFGINVFKVREVDRAPGVTRAPNMPRGVEGLIPRRGGVIPVLSPASFLGLDAQGRSEAMMVAQFAKRIVGFLVHRVDRIVRVDWARMKVPETALAGNRRLISAVGELDGGRLVSILDVEQILADAFG